MNDPKPLSSAPKAVSYIRFSSKKQASGASLARQLEATRAYCEREGLRLDETVALRDLGVSAWSGANAETGALARFLELVNGGEVQPGTRLIVESIDRISRQAPINAFEIMLGLLRAGIKIVTLMDQQVYDAAALNDGRAHVLLALMQRAHEESQTKSRRIRDALARKKAAIISDRKPATANCPAWLRLSDDQAEYLPVPDKVAVIRRALEMIRDGFGLEMVAKTFNAKKVPPLSRRSRRWHQSYISRLVRNRQLIGEYQPHEGTGKDRRPAGDAILGLYPAVIDKSLFYAAQKAQAKRSTKPGRTGSRVNLFSGLVVDTKGATWVATHKGPRDKHRLVSGAARAGVPGHVYQSIPLDHFEDGLMLMIRQLWERRAAPTPQTDRIDDLLATVADLDAKLGALREKIKSAGVKQVVTLVELVPELERQRSEAATEVER
ncbi:MAG: recombinase family protein, partial [Planctomycetota bacterium]